MNLAEAKAFLGWISMRVMFAAGAVIVFTLAFNPTDDSDAPDGARSGVIVRTDYRTGCQYLETADGGITPRMDGSARQVGCR